MAIMKGLFGPFSGKVGTMVGAHWRGIPYIRSLPRPRDPNKLTPAQLAQQRKFAMAVGFTKTIGPLLHASFPQYAIKMTGKNCALSWILKQAITGTAPEFTLDYPRILISRGDLPSAVDADVATVGAGVVRFNWTPNGGRQLARNSDKALLVVYCPELNDSVYHTAAADRSAGIAFINAANFTGKAVQTWLGFLSEDGQVAANSVYTGELVI